MSWKNLKIAKSPKNKSLLWWKPSNRNLGNTKKIKKYKKNQKEKNTKKIEKQEKYHWWKPGNRYHGRKKRNFCQKGENLVNRHLLFPMLHLVAHLLDSCIVSFLLSLSVFCFLLLCSCIHGLSLVIAKGHSPLASLSDILHIESLSR